MCVNGVLEVLEKAFCIRRESKENQLHDPRVEMGRLLVILRARQGVLLTRKAARRVLRCILRLSRIERSLGLSDRMLVA